MNNQEYTCRLTWLKIKDFEIWELHFDTKLFKHHKYDTLAYIHKWWEIGFVWVWLYMGYEWILCITNLQLEQKVQDYACIPLIKGIQWYSLDKWAHKTTIVLLPLLEKIYKLIQLHQGKVLAWVKGKRRFVLDKNMYLNPFFHWNKYINFLGLTATSFHFICKCGGLWIIWWIYIWMKSHIHQSVSNDELC